MQAIPRYALSERVARHLREGIHWGGGASVESNGEVS